MRSVDLIWLRGIVMERRRLDFSDRPQNASPKAREKAYAEMVANASFNITRESVREYI